MDNCIFCKIVAKEIPSQILYEDHDMMAFNDIQPQAPVHILWIPKKHIAGIDAISNEDQELLGKILYKIKEYAKERQWDQAGYRIVTNMGPNGRQSVRHLHFHLLAGRELSEFLG